jgi:hypothetical protein
MQVLVIARIKPGTPVEQAVPFLAVEAAQAWEFYASEQIRQVYYIADKSGAVMIWEGESVESVTQEVNKLPMVKEGILTCEFLPLKPYTGYASLFAQQPNIPSTGAGTTDVAVN